MKNGGGRQHGGPAVVKREAYRVASCWQQFNRVSANNGGEKRRRGALDNGRRARRNSRQAAPGGVNDQAGKWRQIGLLSGDNIGRKQCLV